MKVLLSIFSGFLLVLNGSLYSAAAQSKQLTIKFRQGVHSTNVAAQAKEIASATASAKVAPEPIAIVIKENNVDDCKKFTGWVNGKCIGEWKWYIAQDQDISLCFKTLPGKKYGVLTVGSVSDHYASAFEKTGKAFIKERHNLAGFKTGSGNIIP